MVAKTDEAHQGLSRLFAGHGRDGRLERAYQAVIWGKPPRRQDTIDAPIGRSSLNRQKMAVAIKGRPAVTPLQILKIIPANPESLPLWNAGWKPAAPTRSGCTWPISATRCLAIALMVKAFRQARSGSRPPPGKP